MMDDMGKVKVLKASSALVFTAAVLASVRTFWEDEEQPNMVGAKPNLPQWIRLCQCHSISEINAGECPLAHRLNVDETQNHWEPPFHGQIFTCLQIELCGDSKERAVLQKAFNSEFCRISKKIQFLISLLRHDMQRAEVMIVKQINCCNPEMWPSFICRLLLSFWEFYKQVICIFQLKMDF